MLKIVLPDLVPDSTQRPSDHTCHSKLPEQFQALDMRKLPTKTYSFARKYFTDNSLSNDNGRNIFHQKKVLQH